MEFNYTTTGHDTLTVPARRGWYSSIKTESKGNPSKLASYFVYDYFSMKDWENKGNMATRTKEMYYDDLLFENKGTMTTPIV